MPRSRPVRIAARIPHGFGKRRDGVEMLARENFGRRHQRRLPAGFDDGCRGEQRDHGFARADIALKQAHHPFRLAEVGDDRIKRTMLGQRQRIGQGCDDRAAQVAVAGMRAAGALSIVRAHQPERELAGKKFVIGEPGTRRALRRDVVHVLRPMQGLECGTRRPGNHS